MRLFKRQSLPQHRRASTSSSRPELGLPSVCLFLLFSLPCLFPQKATADTVFINFPAALAGETSTGFGSSSGDSLSGNLVRVGAFNTDPTSLMAGVAPLTNSSDILTSLNTRFTQYTSFAFSNDYLDPVTAIFPATDDDGLPLEAQPAIGTSLQGKDIYLLFYNAATANLATELAIFRMKQDLLLDDPAGSTGIFSSGETLGQRTAFFNLSATDTDLLLGFYDSSLDIFQTANLNAGVNQITSATTKLMNAGSSSTYQILGNNGANSFGVTSLPTWASLDSVTGVITLTPGASISGTFTIGLSAINSLTGKTATGSLAVTVQVATGPAFTSSATVSATAGIAFSHTITTDAPATFTTPSLPAGLNLDPATGVLSGIPRTAVPVNIEIVAARVSSPTQTSTQNLILTVSSPTLAIAALVSGQLTRTAGTAYTIPVTIPAGFTVDSSSITPAISGVTYSAGNLLISSTAAPFAKGTASQAVTLTLTRTSGLDGATVSTSLPFNLRLVAPAPTALTAVGPFEVNVGEDYSLQLSTDLSTLCPNQNIAIDGILPLGLENLKSNLRETGLIKGTNKSTTLPWKFPVDVVADTSTYYEGGGRKTFPVEFRLRNPVAPVITSSLSRLAGVGKSFLSYKLEASGSPAAFTASGLPPGLVLTKEYIITGTPTQAENYTVELEAFNYYRPGDPTSIRQPGTANLRILVSGAKPSTTTPLSGSSNLQVGNPASFSMLAAQQLGLRIAGYGFPPGLSIDSSTGIVTGTPTAAGTYSVTVFIQNGKGWIKKPISLTVR